MTEKQKIFADEYLIDLNATRAYRAAYAKKIVRQMQQRENYSEILGFKHISQNEWKNGRNERRSPRTWCYRN